MIQENLSLLSTAPRRCVALLGVTQNTDNYGVRVLLTSAVEALARCEPQADISVLDYGRSAQSWVEHTSTGPRTLNLLNLRFSWRLYLPNNIVWLLILAALWRALPNADAKNWLRRRSAVLDQTLRFDAYYSLAGGDSFSDIYGLGRFLYVALPQILVLLLGRPLVLLPQTYGPLNGALCRAMARQIVLRASQVFSRDALGADTIKGLAGSKSPCVIVVPDLGFGMTAKPIPARTAAMLDEMRGKVVVVGLNVSRLLYMGGYTGNNMFQLREAFPELVESMIHHLTYTLGVQVLLIPHVCGGPQSQEDETRLCATLEAEWCAKAPGRVSYIEEFLDHQQMKSLIGKCDVFVGARMHACIGAASQGVPTVCLAYSSKFGGVMKPLGKAVRVVDLREATSLDVASVISEVVTERDRLRRQLEVVVPPVCDAARNLRRYVPALRETRW